MGAVCWVLRAAKMHPGAKHRLLILSKAKRGSGIFRSTHPARSTQHAAPSSPFLVRHAVQSDRIRKRIDVEHVGALAPVVGRTGVGTPAPGGFWLHVIRR